MNFKLLPATIALTVSLLSGCKSSQTTTCDDPSSADCPVKATSTSTSSPTAGTSPTAPDTTGAQIKLNYVSTGSLAFSWTPAKDDKTPAYQLAYDLYISSPNPAFGSFDEIAEVMAGTRISGGVNVTTGSFTPTMYMVSGNTYFVNVIVTDQNGERSVYKPRGDIYDSSAIFAWMFDGDTKDKSSSFNDLIYYDGNGSFLYTDDRNGAPNGAGNFIVNTTADRSATIHTTSTITYPSLTATSARTFSFWLKPRSSPINSNVPTQVVFMYGTDTNSPNPQSFGMTIASTAFEFYYGPGNSNFLENLTSDWTHWVLSFDGAIVQAYKNGIFIISFSPALSTPSATKLVFGRADTPFTSNLSDFYDGAIDDVEVFGRSLSATEVTKIYNAQRAKL